MDACDTLEALGAVAADEGRRVSSVVLPARPARHGAVATPLHPELASRLRARGVDELWAHQASAIDLLRASTDVVLATGTASGKSLCYQVPIVESVLAGGEDTALLVFPTKALAQDQLRSLQAWLVPGLRAATYDGDTPTAERARARAGVDVVLTNPEMLHVGILPAHQRWATFLMRLRWVVVDELHSLRGIFGSHVAHVLRRLRRLARHYGADPTFCFASATIGNPGELASALCGRPVRVVDDDGSPRAERRLAVWERPVVDATGAVRASANAETAGLLAHFVDAGHPTLAFTRSRRGAELVARGARARVTAPSARPDRGVAAYRAGLLAEERRRLEHDLATGRLLGVAATSALELGIDVGGLDAIVLNGFPGTLASLWQQAGRAGRSGRRAVAVLVPGDDQLDQWYAGHPGELTSRGAERAVINPDNEFVLRSHVGCAAHELPLTPADEEWFGPALDDVVRDLVLDDLLKPRHGRMYWAGRDAPAPAIGLRSGSSGEYQLLDREGRRVGTVDGARAFEVAHPGALYLHQGRQYRVDHLDLCDRVATLDPADDVDEWTRPRTTTDLAIVDEEARRSLGPATVHVGTVDVTTAVVGYQRRRASTGEVIGTVPLDLPPQRLRTRACWYTIGLTTLLSCGVPPGRVGATVHAVEHALIGMLPRFTICDRWDVGGLSIAEHPQTGRPTIVVYDGYPGGAGIAEQAFAAAPEHVAATDELLRTCACDDGCPGCVQSPKCGNGNEHLDKSGATTWLRTVVAGVPPAPRVVLSVGDPGGAPTSNRHPAPSR